MGTLRTILALSVVFNHCSWHDGFVFVGGRNAVQLFYMISGFLISHVLTHNPAYRNPFKFYANRALRLYPIYYAVAVMALPSKAAALRPAPRLDHARSPGRQGRLNRPYGTTPRVVNSCVDI